MKSAELQPNRRILIIDDNDSIHADFRKILCPNNSRKASVKKLRAALFDKAGPQENGAGFELDSAYQGEEGLEMVRKALAENRPYALAFVDVRMPPGWDGVETISRIWQIAPELQIVICTAYSDYSWDDMRAKVGEPDSLLVLKKPFDNIEVQQIAHALTKKWLLNQQSRLQMAELAHANESLAITQERFSKAFQNSPLPSGIQKVSDLKFIDVNQRLADITGYTREEMIGRAPAELFFWEKPELADQWYQTVFAQGLVQDQKANIRSHTGANREVLISLSPLALGQEPHVLLLAQDVSERAALERQLQQAQKMEAIGQLAAGVAHDFNNILTVIQGHAGIIQLQLNANSPQTKSVEQICKASTRAGTLIRQLLMFSRKQVMQFRHLDINETLRSTISMLERLVGEHVEINFHPQPSLPAIYADSSMIEQIAMNLAVNARDAMPNGGSFTITTSLSSIRRDATPMDPEPRAGQYICLMFKDSGTGIDSQIMHRIFEPFFTTKAAGKGTGLGLSTVFGIVRQHQGWLEVDSSPGNGTTFRIYLSPSPQAAEKTEADPKDALRKGGCETILVVEDEDALREMVVEFLRAQGYSIMEAASGLEALEVWEQANKPINLLVTDMIMPGGILGGELAERLTEKSSNLRVIYTSGYSPGMAGKEVSLLNGGNFLAKPYTVETLAKFVRECLDAPPRDTSKKSPGLEHSSSSSAFLPEAAAV